MFGKWLKWLKSGKEVECCDVPQNGPRVFEVDDKYLCVKDPDMPFPLLNPMQSCFRDNYDPTRHTVVEAGTGTGKSTLAYIAMRSFLENGQRVILMAPLKELVKSLYREAAGIWGAKITGINTGDDKDVGGKYIIVSTPEGYIAAVRSNKEWVNASLMIIDEAHNLFDTSRGGDIDVAMTLFKEKRGRLLLMSATFPNKREVASMFGADLFIAKYIRTHIEVNEMHCPDDLNAISLGGRRKKIPPTHILTISGFGYNKDSTRLKMLRDILYRHKEESVLVFVPVKAAGFCLSESLATPFHCADIEEEMKDRIVADFTTGELKTLLATNTLSQGVNTPADVVIIFGTRRGGYYLDSVDVAQMMGRAGRNKDEALVYLIGDKIEIFHAKKQVLIKSLPLPVESMVLTVLSLNSATKQDICYALDKTYAATLVNSQKVDEAVARHLRFLHACNILSEKGSAYNLTREGALLARYYISPKAYMGYITLARKIHNIPDVQSIDKGCVLLFGLLQGGAYQECPASYEKSMQMMLISHEIDKEVSASKAGLLRCHIDRPYTIPQHLKYQLRDVDRWLGMFSDLEKYKVHDSVPGKEHLQLAVTALKTAVAKQEMRAKKKTVQLQLPQPVQQQGSPARKEESLAF